MLLRPDRLLPRILIQSANRKALVGGMSISSHGKDREAATQWLTKVLHVVEYLSVV